MNAYGFTHLWSQGDFLIRLVALLLLAMSLASWTVILARAWQQMALRRMAAKAGRDFWRAHSLDEALQRFGATGANNPFRALVEDGVHAVQHHADSREELQGAMNLSEWLASNLRATLEEKTNDLQRGLALVASIGSTAPFVGLFGTVWGIYHALIVISVAGQANIDKVAGPVGEALVMTALGLAVAIPAVLGYNALVRGNKAIQARLNRFVQDLHAFLLTGSPLGKATGARLVSGG
ncbi:MAG: MotA/TolQ/ExbB proton channel family protein [Zoogloea sp.]|nr:MotA/TolQ/ExbB proton channel family protein [Zoogloea sp.]